MLMTYKLTIQVPSLNSLGLMERYFFWVYSNWASWNKLVIGMARFSPYIYHSCVIFYTCRSSGV